MNLPSNFVASDDLGVITVTEVSTASGTVSYIHAPGLSALFLALIILFTAVQIIRIFFRVLRKTSNYERR